MMRIQGTRARILTWLWLTYTSLWLRMAWRLPFTVNVVIRGYGVRSGPGKYFSVSHAVLDREQVIKELKRVHGESWTEWTHLR